jgi:hypothetical protein
MRRGRPGPATTSTYTFEDSFPLGTYEVQVLVDHLTNGVSESAAGSLTVINSQRPR